MIFSCHNEDNPCPNGSLVSCPQPLIGHHHDTEASDSLGCPSLMTKERYNIFSVSLRSDHFRSHPHGSKSNSQPTCQEMNPLRRELQASILLIRAHAFTLAMARQKKTPEFSREWVLVASLRNWNSWDAMGPSVECISVATHNSAAQQRVSSQIQFMVWWVKDWGTQGALRQAGD